MNCQLEITLPRKKIGAGICKLIPAHSTVHTHEKKKIRTPNAITIHYQYNGTKGCGYALRTMSAQPWRKNQTKLIEIFYPVPGGGASQCRPALTAALPKTLPKTSVSWITVGCEPEPGEKVVMHITRRRQQAQGRNCSLSLPLFADLLKSLPAQKSAPWIREGKKRRSQTHTHFIIRNCCAARILFRLCLQR